MANVTEQSVWESGVYQLEILDPVQGGPDGIDNLQAKQLANRTLWLKDFIESIESAMSGHTAQTGDTHGVPVGEDFEWQSQAQAKADAAKAAAITYVDGRSVNSGNGLAGGGNLSEDRTLYLIPATVSAATANTSYANGQHEHAVLATDLRNSSNPAELLRATALADHTTSIDHDGRYALRTTNILPGNGLTGGGTLESSRTLHLGEPGTLSGATANQATDTSHTHALYWTQSRNTDSTTIILAAKAFYDHIRSGDHDDRYASIPAGTKMIFKQATAPSGWTFVSEDNDRVLINTSTLSQGGTVGGTWIISGLTVAATTLTEGQMPPHDHGIWGAYVNNSVDNQPSFIIDANNASNSYNSSNVSNSGGGQSHSHSLLSYGTWRPKYANVITCRKN